jgi:DENN domain-containing protein 5
VKDTIITFSEYISDKIDNYPLVDVDFSILMNHLSVENILYIFSYMLKEGQIIFLSDNLSVTTSCIESLISFLYPFEWTHVFIPSFF